MIFEGENFRAFLGNIEKNAWKIANLFICRRSPPLALSEELSESEISDLEKQMKIRIGDSSTNDKVSSSNDADSAAFLSDILPSKSLDVLVEFNKEAEQLVVPHQVATLHKSLILVLKSVVTPTYGFTDTIGIRYCRWGIGHFWCGN